MYGETLVRQIRLPDTFSGGTTFEVVTGDNATVYLRGPSSIDLESQNGTVAAPPQVTTQWAAGMYAVSVRITDNSGNISEIYRGNIQILADITSVPAGTDTRSQNRRTYDAICAVIENRASMDQESYRINNRELKRMPISDLLKLRARYASLVAQENGRGGFREHRVIF